MQGTFLKFQVDWPKTEEKDRFLVNIFSLMLMKKIMSDIPMPLKLIIYLVLESLKGYQAVINKIVSFYLCKSYTKLNKESISVLTWNFFCVFYFFV